MGAPEIIAYTLQSGLLLAVGLVLPRVLRLRHPATKLVYWRVLLFTVVVLPLAFAWSPHRVGLPGVAIEGIAVEEIVTATPVPDGLTVLTPHWLLTAGALISALAVMRLALGLVFLGRCRAAATPLAPIPGEIAGIQDRLGLKVPFLVSNRLAMPVTFGWRRPVVLVPQSFHDLNAEQKEGVACHELLHVARGDWSMTLIEEVVRALLWFHPAVWLLLAEVALAREQVVDAGTVRLTGKRRQYLEALWEVVSRFHRERTALALPLVRRSHLVQRVAQLTKEASMSKSRIAINVIILAVIVAAAGLLGAAFFSPMASAAGASIAASPSGAMEDPGDCPEGSAGPPPELVNKDQECNEITHPVAIHKVDPKYPPSAREEKLMGTVLVEAVINENGIVEDIKVVKSPDERFSDASVEAIQQWTFEPALCDGRPVSVRYKLTIRFALK